VCSVAFDCLGFRSIGFGGLGGTRPNCVLLNQGHHPYSPGDDLRTLIVREGVLVITSGGGILIANGPRVAVVTIARIVRLGLGRVILDVRGRGLHVMDPWDP